MTQLSRKSIENVFAVEGIKISVLDWLYLDWKKNTLASKPLLSPFAMRAIDKIKVTGGLAQPVSGGYWNDKHGAVLNVESDTEGALGNVSRQTIRALEKRGVLRRCYRDQFEWKDPRILAFPVIVTDNEKTVLDRDGYRRFEIVFSCLTVHEAEQWIGLSTNPDKVARGGYGIDAPEDMVQAAG